MPCSKGRGPLVSRGAFYTLSLDPLTQQQMREATNFVRDRVGIRASHSAIVRRALRMYAAHLATMKDAEEDSLPIYSEGHLIAKAIQGSDVRRTREAQR
jgi:hypothetical protein